MAESGTEERILAAAHEVFLEKGMSGARMQEIADKAGINKALLHYYFRSKEKLYQHILQKVFGQLWQRLLSGWGDKEFDLEQFTHKFVASYTELLLKNPYIPMFLFNEIQKNPAILMGIIETSVGKPTVFIDYIQADLQRRGVVHLDAATVLINLLSLTIFPFVARPLLQLVFFNNDTDQYRNFLERRKQEVWLWIEGMLSHQ